MRSLIRTAVITGIAATVLVSGCGSQAPYSSSVRIDDAAVSQPATSPEPAATPTPTPSADADAESTRGRDAAVVHIVDGDTLDVEFGNGTVERVRFPQVDTPERDECGFAEATNVLAGLLPTHEVRLIPTESGPNRDPYDRLLRAMEIDGADVGEQLILSGHARWVQRYAHEDTRLARMYEAAESKARTERAGLWKACGW